jgi:hypothetical protein
MQQKPRHAYFDPSPGYTSRWLCVATGGARDAMDRPYLQAIGRIPPVVFREIIAFGGDVTRGVR